MNTLLNSLGCMEAYTVYKTKNYSIFQESFDNRIDFKNEPTTPKYKKLKESVKKAGRNLEPITVREIENGAKFEVIKGHHRYWATKMTNSFLYFRIDNSATLDESIEETKGTTNWTDTNLLERGIRHNISLCTIVEEIETAYPRLKESRTLTSRLIWGYLKLKGYYGRAKILKMLEDLNTIQELKEIEVKPEDKKTLKEFVFRFLELISITEDNFNEIADIALSYNKLAVNVVYQEQFTKYYKQIARNYDDFALEVERLCKEKSKAKCSAKDKDLYRALTSKDRKFVEQAIIEIATKVDKFDC